MLDIFVVMMGFDTLLIMLAVLLLLHVTKVGRDE
jgi:hypothetical protein